MEPLIQLARYIALPMVRISLGVVLLWIGALKFVDPSPVVGLLDASFSFLAFSGFVYVLGVVEVVAALMLFANFRTQYVGLLLVGLFAGTLIIFLIAPGVSYGEGGIPLLSLAGEFLLKDVVLMAAAVTLVAAQGQRVPSSIGERS
jgi:uncharacterized membrane protein YkgB